MIPAAILDTRWVGGGGGGGWGVGAGKADISY